MVTMAEQFNKAKKTFGTSWFIIGFIGLALGSILIIFLFPLGIFILVCSLACIAGGIYGLKVWIGQCPYCGYSEVLMYGTSVKCPSCQKKVVRRGSAYYRADEG